MALTTNFARLVMLDRAHAETVDLKANTTKVMLVSSGYTPNKDDKYVSTITAAPSKELSGTGYVAGFGGSGRKTMANKAWAQDDANDLVKLTADDITWSAINAGTARYAVVIKEVSTDADSIILIVIDVNPTAGIATDGNDFLLKWGPNGVFKSTSP